MKIRHTVRKRYGFQRHRRKQWLTYVTYGHGITYEGFGGGVTYEGTGDMVLPIRVSEGCYL